MTIFAVFVCLTIMATFISGETQQTPTICVAPLKFQCKFKEELEKDNTTIIAWHYSYDAVEQRERIRQQTINVHGTASHDILHLHKSDTMYVLNMRTRQCTRKRSDRQFLSAQIPNDAEFMGNAHVGLVDIPNGGLRVQSWKGRFNYPKLSGNYTGSWTLNGCMLLHIEVDSVQYGKIKNDLFDCTQGVPDLTIFEPPNECQSLAGSSRQRRSYRGRH